MKSLPFVNIDCNLHCQNAVRGVFCCCRFTLKLGRENVLGISENHDRLGDEFAHGFNKSLLSANSKTGKKKDFKTQYDAN